MPMAKRWVAAVFISNGIPGAVGRARLLRRGGPVSHECRQALNRSLAASNGLSSITVARCFSPRMVISSSVPMLAEVGPHHARAPATCRRASHSRRTWCGRRVSPFSQTGSDPRASASVTPCTSSVTKRFAKPLLAPGDERVAAEELALVRMHEAVEPGFERRVFDGQLAPDEAVGFLQRHRHHRADAERLDAEPRALLHQQVEKRVLHLDGVVQLPAELADEVDAQRVHADTAPPTSACRSARGTRRWRGQCRSGPAALRASAARRRSARRRPG